MRRILAVPVAVCAALLAVGCTHAHGSGIATANGSHASPAPTGRDDAAAFARCMRDHGQQVPDPTADGHLAFDPHPTGATAAWNDALQACQHFMPSLSNGNQGAPAQVNQGPPAQDMEKLRQFAICMRAHGIEMSDPQVGGSRPGNMIIGGRLGNLNRTQVQADPGFKSAMAACQDKLPNAGPSKT